MASYLNQSTINAITNSMYRMHDTFSRSIFVYKNAKKTVVSTSPNYNSIYGRTSSGKNGNVTYDMQVQEFQARVYYTKEDQEYLAENSNQSSTQNKIILPQGSVRIVVKADAYQEIKSARRIDIDGRTFAIKSGGVFTGFLGDEFYSFILTPMAE